jgi:amidophosphoribosyltransferase
MCGVIGILSFLKKNVTPYIGGALCSMCYRGDQASGLATVQTYDPTQPTRSWKRGGDPRSWFRNPILAGPIIDEHPGDAGAGHNRYGTSSEPNSDREAQPGYASWLANSIYICSNGDLPFCRELRESLSQPGDPNSCKFATQGDSEVIAKLIATRALHQGMSMRDAFMDVGRNLNGTFSLVALVNDHTGKWVYAMRDRFGNHPLWVAIWRNKMIIICSETSVIQELVPVIGEPCDDLYPLPPGSLLIASPDGEITTHLFGDGQCHGFCLMELFYFAGRVSYFEGMPTEHGGWFKYGQIRRMLGQQLAREWRESGLPIPDFITGVPESGSPAAEGCAAELKIPYFSVIDKNRYAAGRNFQGMPHNRINDIRSKMWLNGDVNGLHIGVVDDSEVRGDQGTIICGEKLRDDPMTICHGLREDGAEQVTLGLIAPPYIYPCFYGLNTSDPSQLIARGRSDEEVRRIVGADHIIYLSLDGTLKTVKQKRGFFCTACFTGEYLGEVPDGRPEVGQAK